MGAVSQYEPEAPRGHRRSPLARTSQAMGMGAAPRPRSTPSAAKEVCRASRPALATTTASVPSVRSTGTWRSPMPKARGSAR